MRARSSSNSLAVETKDTRSTRSCGRRTSSRERSREGMTWPQLGSGQACSGWRTHPSRVFRGSPRTDTARPPTSAIASANRSRALAARSAASSPLMVTQQNSCVASRRPGQHHRPVRHPRSASHAATISSTSAADISGCSRQRRERTNTMAASLSSHATRGLSPGERVSGTRGRSSNRLT